MHVGGYVRHTRKAEAGHGRESKRCEAYKKINADGTMWIKRKDSKENGQPEFSPAKTDQAAQDCNCGSSSECYNGPVDRIKPPAPMRTDHKRRR
jgi:hypothetical protein